MCRSNESIWPARNTMRPNRTWRGICCAILLLFASPAAAQDRPVAAAVENVSAITNSIGMKLVRIPAGSFRMGSPRTEAERESNEALHDVTITRPFHMGAHEVTQAQYVTIMGEPNRAVFNQGPAAAESLPMETVLWVEADEFCKKLSAREEEKRAGRSYRLPTEAEWEYACRGGTKTAFHVGNSLSSEQANFHGQYPYGDGAPGPYLRKTSKIGSYPPNAFGLYDMHGNVAEWCADWFDPEYYENSPDENPLGPPVGTFSDDYNDFYLVVRGGSWLDDARACRAAYRQQAMHRNRYWWIGFRVVAEMKNDTP